MDDSINLLTCHVGYSPLDKYSNGSSDRLGNGVSGGNGSLDTLMADLMSSLGSDIHETDRRPSAASSRQDTCAACGDEFDYRDDVVNHHNQVWLHTNCLLCSSFLPSINENLIHLHSIITRLASIAKCAVLLLIVQDPVMNTMANSTANAITMWSRNASCVLDGIYIH